MAEFIGPAFTSIVRLGMEGRRGRGREGEQGEGEGKVRESDPLVLLC